MHIEKRSRVAEWPWEATWKLEFSGAPVSVYEMATAGSDLGPQRIPGCPETQQPLLCQVGTCL